MTTSQVAAQLGCDRSTASKWAKNHGLQRPGHDYVWSLADIEKFRQRPKPGPKRQPEGREQKASMSGGKKEKEMSVWKNVILVQPREEYGVLVSFENEKSKEFYESCVDEEVGDYLIPITPKKSEKLSEKYWLYIYYNGDVWPGPACLSDLERCIPLELCESLSI